jgi:hypothetical protein
MFLSRCVIRTMPVILLVFALVLPVHGETANGDVVVEYDREEVVLEPDGETSLLFTVTNHGDEPLGVAFEFESVDAPRHSVGYFSTIFATLQPGESRETELVVTSRARPSDEPEVSNFVVRVSWGTDIQIDDEQRPVGSTVEGTWEHEFQVQFEAEPGVARVAAVVALAVVVGIAVILLYPVWAGHTEHR